MHLVCTLLIPNQQRGSPSWNQSTRHSWKTSQPYSLPVLLVFQSFAAHGILPPANPVAPGGFSEHKGCGKKTTPWCSKLAGCFPPYRARRASGAEVPEKWGKITKFPSPVRPPKMGKNYRKITKIVFSEYFFPFLGPIFPIFGGRTGEGNFVIFPHFLGTSAPEALWAL